MSPKVRVFAPKKVLLKKIVKNLLQALSFLPCLHDDESYYTLFKLAEEKESCAPKFQLFR